MRKNGHDKTIEKSIIQILDKTARKHGMKDVRHAVDKWTKAQGDKLSLAKKQKVLKQALAEVKRKLAL